MSEIYESSLQLHDLCEDVFHKILGYIPRMHLYFSVRNVCKAMRQKVDGFISLIGKFVIATRDKPPTDNLACFVTMFYVFKTKSHPYLMHLKFLPDLPTRAMSKYQTLKAHEELNGGITRTKDFIDFIDTFGGIVNGKLVMGYYYTQKVLKKIKMESPGLMGRFKHRHKVFHEFYRLVPCVFVYEESINEWNDVTPNETMQLEYERNVTCRLSFCVVDEAILVGLFLSCSIYGSPLEFRIVRFQFPYLKEKHNSRSTHNEVHSNDILSNYVPIMKF